MKIIPAIICVLLAVVCPACGEKPIATRIEDGDIASVERQLDEGLDPDQVDELDRAPLHWAAHYGQPDIATLLIDRGASIELEGLLPAHPGGVAVNEIRAVWKALDKQSPIMAATFKVRLLTAHVSSYKDSAARGVTPGGTSGELRVSRRYRTAGRPDGTVTWRQPHQTYSITTPGSQACGTAGAVGHGHCFGGSSLSRISRIALIPK